MLVLYLSLLDGEDEGKFERLYYKYRRLMFTCAKEILKDDVLAEDAVHEAFLRLTKHMKGIDEVKCNKTLRFVVIVVESAAKDIYRKEKRFIPEGYVPAIEDRDENSLVLSYEKEDENGLQGIVIAEDEITDGLLVSDDNEYVSESIVDLLGHEGRLSRKADGCIHVLWEADGGLYIVIADVLTEDEILKVCNTLK